MSEHPRLVALLVDAAPAEEAHPACGVERAEHPVALRYTGHALACGNHRPHVLVADREPGLDLDAPVVDVQVGTANSRGVDAYDRIVRRERLGVRPLLDGDPPRLLEGHGAHGAYPREASR